MPQTAPPAPAKVAPNPPLPPESVQKLKDFIRALPSKDDQLINVLHEAQEIFGYLPRQVQNLVAQEMGVSLAHVYGIVTFYAFFNMQPSGRHRINICQGTACFVKGAPRILSAFKDRLQVGEGEVTPDGRFSITTVRCVGGCALAPVVMVDDRVFGHVAPEQIRDILADFS